MAFLYLSPSTQEWDPYINGGNEDLYMGQVADAMEPWLRACGISFTRNDRDLTVADAIQESNAGQYDLHLALHSNAAPELLSGTLQGSDVYYDGRSPMGRLCARIIARNLRRIYPRPDLVSALPTKVIDEVVKVRWPSVLIEFAYHDDPEDAEWIVTHISEIAENICLSLAEYFDLPFLVPRPPVTGIVGLTWGSLNIRARPSAEAPIVAEAYDGAALTVWNQWRDWLVVELGNISGFVHEDYVTLV